VRKTTQPLLTYTRYAGISNTVRNSKRQTAGVLTTALSCDIRPEAVLQAMDQL